MCRTALATAAAASAGLTTLPVAHAQQNVNAPTTNAVQITNGNAVVNITTTVDNSTNAGATGAVYSNGNIGWTVTNSGTVTGTNGGGGAKPGVFVDDAGVPVSTLTNTGTITANANRAVYFTGGAVVTNSGTIGGAGTTVGVKLNGAGASTANVSSITNSGLIQGTIGVQFGNQNSTLTNTGTIIGTGGTAVQFGNATNTLILGSGSSITGNVVGGGGTNNLILQGTGTLPTNLQNFNANLTLNGTAWHIANSVNFASVTVTTGQLAVDSGATLTGPVTIASGGTLSGFGTVAGAVTNNAGTVKPGGSIGTLTVTGNYTQAASGNLTIEISSSQTSKLAVTGSATLAGSLTVVPTGSGYARSTTYQILTATGGVTGTFSSIANGTTLSGFSFSASYLANEVDLTVLFAGFGTFGTPNQRAAGTALNNVTATGALATAITALGNLSTQAQILTGIDQIGGSAEGYGDLSTAVLATGRTTVGLVNQQMLMAQHGAAGAAVMAEGPGAARVQLASLDPVAALAQGAAPSYVTTPWTAWLSGFGLFGAVGGNGNAHTLNYATGGTTFGADYRVDPAVLIGGFAGYAGTGTGTTGLTGTGTVDSYSVGGYASYAASRLYVNGVLGYAYNDETLRRTIGFAGVPTTVARGNFQGDQFLASLEAGRSYDLDAGIVATPFVALQASALQQSGVTETGAGSLNLTVNGQSRSSARTVLGSRFEREVDLGIDRPVSIGVKLGWAHEFSDTLRPVTASFGGQPVGGFTVQAAPLGRDSAVLGAGLAAKLDGGANVFVRYDGDINGRDDGHAVIGGIRFTW